MPLLIQGFTADTNQKQSLVLPDGTRVSVTLLYIPMQYGWFIQELVYKNFTLKNYRIVAGPNILNQYKNKIPFGIACVTADNFEPMLQDAFSSGYATLYLLTATDIAQLAGLTSG